MALHKYISKHGGVVCSDVKLRSKFIQKQCNDSWNSQQNCLVPMSGFIFCFIAQLSIVVWWHDMIWVKKIMNAEVHLEGSAAFSQIWFIQGFDCHVFWHQVLHCQSGSPSCSCCHHESASNVSTCMYVHTCTVHVHVHVSLKLWNKCDDSKLVHY